MSEIGKSVLALLCLLVLLAATVMLSFIELGAFNPVLNLAIAAAKAVIIAMVFMHLAGPSLLPRLAATATAVLLWLGILYGLTLIG